MLIAGDLCGTVACHQIVIPAQAGIQKSHTEPLDPRLRGDDK